MVIVFLCKAGFVVVNLSWYGKSFVWLAGQPVNWVACSSKRVRIRPPYLRSVPPLAAFLWSSHSCNFACLTNNKSHLKRNGNRYDAGPTLVHSPSQDLTDLISGTEHCAYFKIPQGTVIRLGFDFRATTRMDKRPLGMAGKRSTVATKYWSSEAVKWHEKL